MKIIILFLLFSLINCQVNTTVTNTTNTTNTTIVTLDLTQKCTCTMILAQSDCLQNSQCYWSNAQCLQIPAIATTNYCDVQGTACNSVNGCAMNTKCVRFTGCTQYVGTNYQQCQQVSIKCTSDGQRCLSLQPCALYTNQASCYINDTGQYCTWGTSCTIANQCSQLPISLTTDSQCRGQINTCTASATGGCVVSGSNCNSQISQAACVTNLAQTVNCFWTGTTCVDKICTNALQTLNTDSACKSFLSTCTVAASGQGCMTIPSNCKDLTSQLNCLVNSSGSTCYWNPSTSKCDDKACENAPSTYSTDALCITWLSTCTVNGNSNGCVVRPAQCATALQPQCITNASGGSCYWNGTTCVDRTCANAPTTYTSDAQCNGYLSSCTVNTSLTGCITRQATCDGYTQQQCYKTLTNNPCFFIAPKCVSAECSGAPLTYNTQAQCTAFNPTCTVSSAGCAIKTCINILSQTNCTLDYQGNQCYWGSVCASRTCSNAPSTLLTDAACRGYLKSCTLNVEKGGCIDISATQCSSITYQSQCYTTKTAIGQQTCSWNSSQNVCRALNCLDAPILAQTHQTCQQFSTTCTVGQLDSNLMGSCVTQMSSCTGLSGNQCFGVVLTTGAVCSYGNGQCRARICSDGPYTTEAACRAYMSTCTVNSSGTSCMNEPASCQQYTSSTQCTIISTPLSLCGWTGCEVRTCLDAPATTYTDATCQSFLAGCTVNSTLNGCISQSGLSCGSLTQVQCPVVVLTGGLMCTWVTSTNICRQMTCADISPTSATTQTKCQIIPGCMVGPQGIGCVTQVSACISSWDQVQCNAVTILNGTVQSQCIYSVTSGSSTYTCNPKTCSSSAYVANGLTIYTTHTACQAFMSSCTIGPQGCIPQGLCSGTTSSKLCTQVVTSTGNSCSWNGTLCQNRVCSDFRSNQTTSIIATTDAVCKAWLSTCTATSDQTNCMNQLPQCSQYTKNYQCVRSTSLACKYDSQINACRQAICTDADQSYTTQAQCSSFISSCTVAKGGGCMAAPSTCTGIDQSICALIVLNTGSSCSFNGTVCQTRVCIDAPQSYNTDTQCRSWLSTCTVNVTGAGCQIEQTQCSLYQNKAQCQSISATSTLCGWNPGCIPRTCSNIANAKTDAACNQSLNYCGIDPTGSFCIPRQASCLSYTTQLQCTYATKISGINVTQSPCFWTNNSCQVLTCAILPGTLSTDAQCRAQLSSCTLANNGQGCQSIATNCSQLTTQGSCVTNAAGVKCLWTGSCIDIQLQCSSYLTQSNCSVTSTGQNCVWLNSLCVARTCDNAPKNLITNAQCQSYQSGCTTNGKGCISISQYTCPYLLPQACIQGSEGLCTTITQCSQNACMLAPSSLTTDAQCASYNPKCTTNTNGCIQNLNCSDAYMQESCITNSQGGLCAWTANGCMDLSCSTAPSTTVTDNGCIQYLNNTCTTNGKGCVTRARCIDAVVQAACTFAYNGTKCNWYNNACQVSDCTVYYYPTYTLCQAQMATCTSNGSQCINIAPCASYNNAISCVVGTDGNCIWQNSKCYIFNQCTDLIFSTDALCKGFSPQCTSNGYNCIPLSTCALSNQSSCYTGIDGTCIWTPLTLQASSQYVCKVFTQCSDALYLTNSQCYQQSNGKCTSDGVASCVALQTCTAYLLQASCYQSNIGQIKVVVNGVTTITQTGICAWVNGKCRDQTCTDLTGTSHATCNSQLTTCTYNGSGCAIQTTCANYPKRFFCESAMGTDGLCIWDLSALACRVMLCTDVAYTMCSTFASTCITDGSQCVTQGKCSQYLTQGGCSKGGTDGTCMWNNGATSGTCSLLSKCSDAASNKATCQSMQNRCYWYSTTNSTSNVTTTDCQPLQCNTNNTACSNYYSWDLKSYTLCSTQNGTCQNYSPAQLTQAQCFMQSLYTYVWNNKTTSCQACYTPTVTNNTNTTTTTNTTNQTNTTQNTKGIIIILTVWAIMNQ